MTDAAWDQARVANAQGTMEMEDAQTWGTIESDDWWFELDDETQKAFSLYKSGNYGVINDALRGGSRMTDEAASSIARMDAALDTASLSEDVVAVRHIDKYAFNDMFGTTKADYEFGGFWKEDPRRFVGATFGDDAYTSTSMSSDFTWGDIPMEVRVPRGYQAAYLDPAMFNGSSLLGSHECELLLKRGTRFRIVGMDTELDQGAHEITKLILEVI